MDFETCERCRQVRIDRRTCTVEIGPFRRVRSWCSDCQYNFLQIYDQFDEAGKQAEVDVPETTEPARSAVQLIFALPQLGNIHESCVSVAEAIIREEYAEALTAAWLRGRDAQAAATVEANAWQHDNTEP